jgi:hypothetical protein
MSTLKELLKATAADPGQLNRIVQHIATADDPVGEAKEIIATAEAIAKADYDAGVQQAREAEARRQARSVDDIIAGIPMDSGTAAELRAAIAAASAPPPAPAPEPAPEAPPAP